MLDWCQSKTSELSGNIVTIRNVLMPYPKATIKSISVQKNFLDLLKVILKDSGADSMQLQKCMGRVEEIVTIEYEEEQFNARNSNSHSESGASSSGHSPTVTEQ